VFGIGVSREQDFMTLQRFHHHLLPGGMLMLETHLPYKDAEVWSLWRREARMHLPEPWPEDIGKIPDDDHEYKLHYRRVAFDPLEQRITGEMRMLLFKDEHLATDDTYTLTSNYYFRNEMRMLLEKAGFTVKVEKGDWTDADVTADHDVIVYFAKK
jgi:hypothetical protein